MMGHQATPQPKLFYTGFQLDKRVRRDHPLRKISKVVDFDFTYKEVAETYGDNGNVSVPPPVLLKLMLLLVFYNVRSERELMETLPERLDWLWFLGYDLDDEVPNHSVLSKARKRWGREVFQRFFERVMRQCVAAGLVDGRKIFVDASLIDADASQDSVVDTRDLNEQLSRKYRQLEARLDEAPSARAPGPYTEENLRYVSATDPDAALMKRGESKLRYQSHRAVEGSSEIITATALTPGDVSEDQLLMALKEDHEATTGESVQTVVADSKYGTKENYLACRDAGIQAHIPAFQGGTDKRLEKRGLFMEDRFVFDAKRDVFVCPAGQELRRRTVHARRQSIEYAALSRVCAVCELREQCTKSKSGRSVNRHLRQDDLDEMLRVSKSDKSRRDLKRRQHLCEGSFGAAKRYGYKRARWRRLWRVEIQNYLICTVQNITKLVKHRNRRFYAAVTLRPDWCHDQLLSGVQSLIHNVNRSFSCINELRITCVIQTEPAQG
jgi:transposase